MGKSKTDKPKINVTASLGLFYVAIQRAADPVELIGPFTTADDAETEKKRQKRLCKRTVFN